MNLSGKSYAGDWLDVRQVAGGKGIAGTAIPVARKTVLRVMLAQPIVGEEWKGGVPWGRKQRFAIRMPYNAALAFPPVPTSIPSRNWAWDRCAEIAGCEGEIDSSMKRGGR